MIIEIPFKIHEQIDFYVQKSTVEVSGLGKVIVTPSGYKVTEVILLTQENTATHTEINPAATTKAMFELRNSPGGLYFWWHSHVNMEVFWSGTDKATIEEIGQNGLCVAVVFNKKKEMRGACYLKGSDLSPDLYFGDIPVSIVHDGASEETKAMWEKDFDEKCKTKVYEPSKISDLFPVRNTQGQLPEDERDFNLVKFEDKLTPDDKVKMGALYNTIIYSFSEAEIDKCLKQMLEVVKNARGANKHEKKKAYREYKELAIEQKNYLKEREEAFNASYQQ